MFIADLAGIGIFATGGIGGVHRGAEETFDISADLVELVAHPRRRRLRRRESILDIEQDARVPGAQGVAIVGYRCDEFPAFYARSAGFRLEHRCDGLHDLARMIRLQREIGPGGLLIANPIPQEQALEEAVDRGAHRGGRRRSQGARRGRKEATPFLLRRVVEPDRRPQPRGQCRADQEQRDARRAGGGRIAKM